MAALQALVLALLFSRRADAQCSDELGCSLAGQCVAGKCLCEAWTKGEDCSVLRLAPLAKPADLQSVVQVRLSLARAVPPSPPSLPLPLPLARS